MKLLICSLFIAGTLMINVSTAQAQPFRGILPAAVNDKQGNIFWCDAHRQMKRMCKATEIDSIGTMVLVRSAPTNDCEGGFWGWILVQNNEVSVGYTVTPDKKFGVTVKDLCSPDAVVTFRPNSKKPNYDDLVGISQGRELFRYKRFK